MDRAAFRARFAFACTDPLVTGYVLATFRALDNAGS
jgi:hypothetical protein